MKNILTTIYIGTTLILLSGCAYLTPTVKVPSTSMQIDIKKGTMVWTSPKDSAFTNLCLVAGTNGTFSLTIAGLQDSLNPTNISLTGNSTAEIISAQGQAIVNGINAAANAGISTAIKSTK